jgi:hypothetical protein
MYFKINPHDLAFVKFIVESYEGIAVLRTVDPKEGIVEWMISPDLVEDAERLLRALKKEIPIVVVSPPRNTAPVDYGERRANEIRGHEFPDHTPGQRDRRTEPHRI